MRKKIVVGNWKMNINKESAFTLVNKVINDLPIDYMTEVVFAPSYVYLDNINQICSTLDNFHVAAQDCSEHVQGSFTGEVSAQMLASCGIKYVILGHSERRLEFNETNVVLKLKVDNALANNLNVIFCCGENIKQRNEGLYFDWIESQISESLFHLTGDQFINLVIAYEPIWAIGTGLTATPEQAQEIHSHIRNIVSKKYGYDVANNISILYGGSCNPSNAANLFVEKDIDGGLIGGASLDPKDFSSIIQSF